MAAVWTEDPTIGNALAGVASAMYGGPMLQLHATEAMQGIMQRRMEMQRLQQQMQLSKQLGDLSSGMLGGGNTGTLLSGGPMIGQDGTSGSQASTGIGNIGGGGDQSSSSPSSGAPQPGGTIGQPGAGTQRGQASAGNLALAPYYKTLMQLQATTGNTAGLQETMKEAAAILRENFGATDPNEAIQLHGIMSDLKGPAANNFANQLQNHVEAGNQLTIPQAVFMGRWAGAAAPLTRDSSGAFVRGALPVSPAVMAELQRHGISMPGFPGISTGASGPAAPTPTAGAPSPLAPGAVAQGPQWTTLDAPLTPVQQAAQDAKHAEMVRNDPLFQAADAQTNAAQSVLTSLGQRSTAGEIAALAGLIRTVIPNARASLQGGSEAEEQLLSQRQMFSAELEKLMTNKIRLLPDAIRRQVADLALAQADAAKTRYDSYYERLRAPYRARGGDDQTAIPVIPRLSEPPNLTTPENALPAPRATQAPGPRAAPGSVPSQGPTTRGDLEKLLGGQ